MESLKRPKILIEKCCKKNYFFEHTIQRKLSNKNDKGVVFNLFWPLKVKIISIDPKVSLSTTGGPLKSLSFITYYWRTPWFLHKRCKWVHSFTFLIFTDPRLRTYAIKQMSTFLTEPKSLNWDIIKLAYPDQFLPELRNHNTSPNLVAIYQRGITIHTCYFHALQRKGLKNLCR